MQTVLGYPSVMEAFGRISSSTCPSAALFAHGNLDIAFTLVSFSPSGVWMLPLEHVVFGTRAWFQQWIHVLRVAFVELHIFSACGALRSEAFVLHSAEWRSVHS